MAHFVSARERGNSFTNSLTSGFTLIELLVVIAIIAILSTVVIGGLQSARAKGADAGIKANLVSIRTLAELVYDTKNCYTSGTGGTDLCGSVVLGAASCPAAVANDDRVFSEPSIDEMIKAAGRASNQSAGRATASCYQAASSGAWAVSVPLKAAVGKHWCLDSTGASRQTALPVTATVCPAAG